MNRRDFLQRAVTAGTMSFALGGFTVRAYGRTPLLDALLSTSVVDRVLVLVQLIGGNDGLNTVIPLDQYSELWPRAETSSSILRKCLPLHRRQASIPR